jgi:hypothetical protein
MCASYNKLQISSSDEGQYSISVAFWVGYGFSFWNTGRGVDLQWRLSVIMQLVPALFFCIGAPFLTERYESPDSRSGMLAKIINSPRWLLEKDHTDAAVKALTLLRGRDDLELVQAELEEIRANILWHKMNSVTSFKVFFQQKPLWSRLWRAWALQFLQQMSGAAGIR